VYNIDINKPDSMITGKKLRAKMWLSTSNVVRRKGFDTGCLKY